MTVLSIVGGLLRSPVRGTRLARSVFRSPVPVGPRRLRGELRRLRRQLPLARLRPDVVHYQWESAAVGHHPLADVWKCPIVISCRGSGVDIYPHFSSRRRLVAGYPVVFGRAAAIQAVSEACMANALRLGADPAKTLVIYPGVDLDRFRPAPERDSDVLRIVSVAELRWPKGYEYGLRALGLLSAAGVPFTYDVVGGEPPPIVGVASDLPRLRHTAADLGLADRVTWHGELPHDDVAARLRDADVLFHPSLSEGLPNVALEAMACGLPIVAVDQGGTREIVRDGTDGVLVPARDPQAAAAALERLWRDPALRRLMGARGRERVAEFPVRRMVDAWDELLAEVVA